MTDRPDTDRVRVDKVMEIVANSLLGRGIHVDDRTSILDEVERHIVMEVTRARYE